MELRLLQMHYMKAQRLALGLFQAASSIVPLEFCQPIVEDVTMDLAEFAFHARRVNQIAKLSTELAFSINERRFAYQDASVSSPIETSYERALNRLVHPSTYSVGHIKWDGEQIFLRSNSNIIIAFALTTTNRINYPKMNVEIFGLSYAFLLHIRNIIRSKFPQHEL